MTEFHPIVAGFPEPTEEQIGGWNRLRAVWVDPRNRIIEKNGLIEAHKYAHKTIEFSVYHGPPTEMLDFIMKLHPHILSLHVNQRILLGIGMVFNPNNVARKTFMHHSYRGECVTYGSTVSKALQINPLDLYKASSFFKNATPQEIEGFKKGFVTIPAWEFARRNISDPKEREYYLLKQESVSKNGRRISSNKRPAILESSTSTLMICIDELEKRLPEPGGIDKKIMKRIEEGRRRLGALIRSTKELRHEG